MTDPCSLINDFVKDRLHGNLYELVNFDIAQLKGDRKYGFDRGSSFDCDNTNLSRAIYSVVFEGVWKDMNYKTLCEGKYRGDTINSFNTTFGKPVVAGGFIGINKFGLDEKLSQRVKRFYSQYHTVGNFMVLPNAHVGRYSLNTFRGSYWQWKDYIDKFVETIYLYLTCSQSEVNETFNLLMEMNKDDFEPYKKEEGFQLLIDKLLLNGCIDEDGKPKNLFDTVYYWNSKLSKNAYIEHIDNYLNFCERFIRNRGMKIVEIINSKM